MDYFSSTSKSNLGPWNLDVRAFNVNAKQLWHPLNNLQFIVSDVLLWAATESSHDGANTLLSHMFSLFRTLRPSNWQGQFRRRARCEIYIYLFVILHSILQCLYELYHWIRKEVHTMMDNTKHTDKWKFDCPGKNTESILSTCGRLLAIVLSHWCL